MLKVYFIKQCKSRYTLHKTGKQGPTVQDLVF